MCGRYYFWMMIQTDLDGKKILVVGASGGMGASIVDRCVSDGADVLVWGRNAPTNAQAAFEELDVTKETDAWSVSPPESLDGLVYCPGTITLGAFPRLSDEQFIGDYAVNVLGAARVIRTCIRALAKGSGSVVLFSTVAAQVGLSFHASIAAAKSGVEGLARSLAAEYAAKGVRFNVIAPSITDTPLASDLLSNEKRRSAAEERHPIKGIGSPEQVSAAAAFFLSDAAAWTTGTVLSMDGGMARLRP